MSEHLEKYLELWNLSHPELLAETFTSYVYRVRLDQETVILKLLTPVGVVDEAGGPVALACYNGASAVRVLRYDTQAQLLEYAEGHDLSLLVRRGEDERATHIIADVLSAIHHAARNAPADGLRPLTDWFRALFTQAEQDQANGTETIYTRGAHIAEKLLAHPQEETVLHGDIHHQNIRYSAGRGWLTLDPKGLFGERTYDTANTLCNPVDMPELVHNPARLLRTAAILAERLAIDYQRLLSYGYAYACLSASWSLQDDQNPEHALTVAHLLEPHL